MMRDDDEDDDDNYGTMINLCSSMTSVQKNP